ncbi:MULTISPECIES: DUF167 domain-containing protein [Protofrankia]|uniref:DUF167 domain-containing protein n=1 Tax=Protofrankia TaxID=2994361 RepID=UPI000978AE8E|nr:MULTISPECIES: DUF167 domain-containing protein [Protofrankia]
MRLTIRVSPRSARTSVGGSSPASGAGASGESPAEDPTAADDPTSGSPPDAATPLVVRVTAPAVDGQATESALRALATAFGVRRREVVLVRGATSRTKIVEISGLPESALRSRLAELTAAPGK